MQSNGRGRVTVIGGGLAGTEAAWQAARRGLVVSLHEMKPCRFSPAHRNPDLAELVCSNSLRSADPHSAVGLLKEEMRLAGSLVMKAALETRVPAGKALAVDRELFAREVTRAVEAAPAISIIREEVTDVPKDGLVIIATGPLTSDALARAVQGLVGVEYLHFYDAIAPIVLAESLDLSRVFRQSRYGEPGEGDYLNCPLDRAGYEAFVRALLDADKVPFREFEEARYFEGCLPLEVMAERGPETLRFGPMKPVGLTDPATGATPHAVVQLRQEDLERTMYNMVGFQTKLTWPEQERVFRTIPGLERAEFVRLGSIHRNTFVCAPEVLLSTLQLRKAPNVLLAGQISGVEGYVESTAMGWLAGVNASRLAQGREPLVPPPVTAHGALVRHISTAASRGFQPMNVNFGLFPRLESRIPRKERGRAYAARALAAWEGFLGQTLPSC